MKDVIFLPWQGKNYSKMENKILVLGESHYSDTDYTKPTEFTTDVMNLFLKYKNGNGEHEGWMNTYTKFTNVLRDDSDMGFEELNSFWNSVIFYNYVQKATEGPRVSPKEEDFEKSYCAFKEVLKKYNPDTIIVWGDRLWNRIPDDLFTFNKKTNIHKLDLGKVSAQVIEIYHPSSSKFNYEYWKSVNKPSSLTVKELDKLYVNY